MKLVAALLALVLIGCGGMPKPALEPRVTAIEAPRIVIEKCKDHRPQAEAYPDTEDALAAIPKGDFETLGKVFRAGRNLRDARLAADDIQIKGCAGE